MRIGVDSYSYHRLCGEIRPGERDPGHRFADPLDDVVAECRRLGLDGVSLETCFLPPPDAHLARRLRAVAGEHELVLAWGHPHGLCFGRDPAAAADLHRWIGIAGQAGAPLVRLVVASPALRPPSAPPPDLAAVADAVATACDVARAEGVALAIENHADLTVAELARVLGLVADERVGVCFDTANALRMGDDPVAGARALGRHVRQVHLKDCAPASADAVAGPASVPYGEGIVDIAGVLAALAQAGFTGLVCVELAQLPGDVDERVMVEQAVRWLRAQQTVHGAPDRAASPP